MFEQWRRSTMFGLMLIQLLLPRAPEALAQRSAHVRMYRPAGTYPANVTISASGTVLSKSGDSAAIVLLDGYRRQEVTMPVESTYRVYQSRSMQLWSLAREGLWLYHNGEWTLHRVPEVRNELATNPLRQLRQISLLPAEVNHVLILLSDRLLSYQAATGEAKVLKMAAETGLGEFVEIQEGAEDSIWISGTFGLAHIQEPARRITAQTAWREHISPETNLVHSFQRPFEYKPGNVTVTANGPGGENPRFVVHLRRDEFTWVPILPEKIKQAWTGWDEAAWGYSTTELFRVDQGPEVRLRKEPVVGAQYEVGVETNGVFWIASSEGILRYAPFLWRSRSDLDGLQSAVHSMAYDRDDGALWFATPEGLIWWADGEREIFAWPESLENLLPPRESIFDVAGSRVLIAAQEGPVLFDRVTKRFTPMATAPAVHVHLLGELADGSVCAWFEHSNRERPVDLRFFNGEEFQPMQLPEFSAPETELSTVREIGGEFWIGTSAGAIFIRPMSGAVEFHGPDQGLPKDRVYSINAVGQGRVWAGLDGRLYEYDGQRWELRLRTADRVHSILVAAGSAWVGTPTGIHRFFQDAWIPHGANEGLPAGVYTLRLWPGDQLWAGTSRGTSIFHANADLDPPRMLPPILQEPQTPSTLEPTTISFRGHDKWDYTLPADLLFSYRLDEGAWTSFSNTATKVFQNLSSGVHVIEVLAMDRNGNKASSPSSMEFSVIVPWFQDPRLLVVSAMALCVTLVLAGFAVNRHFQLKRSYAEIGQIVAQRTAELERANQELLHSQKMRAIGTMAAGIAHDFNNILSIIKGSAQIIESNVEDKDKIRTRVNRIQTVVEQGTAIVKALLGLGRVNETELAPCDIADLLQQTRKLLSDRFPETVQFHVDIEDDLPHVICSQEVLQQTLLNLILNAVEAMGNEGLVQLRANQIRQLPEDLVLDPAPAESYIRISVIDQGGGIAPDNLPRIFEPFFTTKAFSSRRGTGLGLSMVYELAKGLDYGLAVETKIGEGSCFSIILPIRVANPSGSISLNWTSKGG